MPMINDFFTPIPKKRDVKIRGKKGIIFNNLSRPKIALFYGTIIIFTSSIFYLSYLYTPLIKAVFKYQITNRQIPNSDDITVILPTPTPSNEFELSIPKIGAQAKVVKEVSPFNKEEYNQVLSQDMVALAKGSFEPGSGKGKSSFIFAHSTNQGINLVRNNSTFYLLNDLTVGDMAHVSLNGKTYSYKIYDKKVVGARDVEYLEYADSEREVLIMQTCWPLGTDWKRLLVFGELITN